MSQVTSTEAPSPIAPSVQKLLDAAKKDSITYGTQRGYFVSAKRFAALVDEIDRLSMSGEITSAQAVAMEEEVAQLRKGRVEADLMLANYEAEAKQFRAKYQEFNEAAAEAKQKWTAHTDELKKQIASLRAKLDETKAESVAARNAADVAAKGYDPEEALRWKGRSKLLSDQVTSLNDQISQLKHQQAVLSKEKDSAEKNAAKALAEANERAKVLAEAKQRKAFAMSDLPPVDHVDVVINSDFVKLALGDKGRQWLERALLADAINIRERLFDLVNAAKSSREKTIRGVADLLQVALNWVKRQSYAARLAVKPWVDEIASDLATGFLKSLKYYREKLESLVSDLKVVAAKSAKQGRKAFESAKTSTASFMDRFMSEVCAWRDVLWNRTKRTCRNAYKTVSSSVVAVWNSATGFMVAGYQYVKPRSAVDLDVDDKITLFDAEEEAALMAAKSGPADKQGT